MQEWQKNPGYIFICVSGEPVLNIDCDLMTHHLSYPVTDHPLIYMTKGRKTNMWFAFFFMQYLTSSTTIEGLKIGENRVVFQWQKSMIWEHKCCFQPPKYFLFMNFLPIPTYVFCECYSWSKVSALKCLCRLAIIHSILFFQLKTDFSPRQINFTALISTLTLQLDIA